MRPCRLSSISMAFFPFWLFSPLQSDFCLNHKMTLAKSYQSPSSCSWPLACSPDLTSLTAKTIIHALFLDTPSFWKPPPPLALDNTLSWFCFLLEESHFAGFSASFPFLPPFLMCQGSPGFCPVFSSNCSPSCLSTMLPCSSIWILPTPPSIYLAYSSLEE